MDQFVIIIGESILFLSATERTMKNYKGHKSIIMNQIDRFDIYRTRAFNTECAFFPSSCGTFTNQHCDQQIKSNLNQNEKSQIKIKVPIKEQRTNAVASSFHCTWSGVQIPGFSHALSALMAVQLSDSQIPQVISSLTRTKTVNVYTKTGVTGKYQDKIFLPMNLGKHKFKHYIST